MPTLKSQHSYRYRPSLSTIRISAPPERKTVTLIAAFKCSGWIPCMRRFTGNVRGLQDRS